MDEQDNRETVEIDDEDGLQIILDDKRSVECFLTKNGYYFRFTSHGIQTKIALSGEALAAAVYLADCLLTKNASAVNT